MNMHTYFQNICTSCMHLNKCKTNLQFYLFMKDLSFNDAAYTFKFIHFLLSFPSFLLNCVILFQLMHLLTYPDNSSREQEHSSTDSLFLFFTRLHPTFCLLGFVSIYHTLYLHNMNSLLSKIQCSLILPMT